MDSSSIKHFFKDSIEWGFFIILSSPVILSLILHLNYWINDKGQFITVDIKQKLLIVQKNDRIKSIPYDKINKVIYYRGRKDESYLYSLPYMFYHYYKIITDTDEIIITNLTADQFPYFTSKMITKLRPLNFIF